MATIALVDDDENIVEALKAFFEAEGYQVRAYHDGAAALAGLSEVRFLKIGNGKGRTTSD